MNVKGLKVTDILEMDWNDLRKLDEKQMKQVTSRLVSVANKRLRKLESVKLGKYSMAYKKYQEQGRFYSVKNKDLKETQQEFRNVKQFLEMKSSSTREWKKIRSKMEQRVASYTDGESIQWGDKTWSKYWTVYRQFEENHRGTFKKGDSDRWQAQLKEIFSENDKRHGKVYFSEIIEDKWEDLQENPEDEDEDETEEIELDY